MTQEPHDAQGVDTAPRATPLSVGVNIARGALIGMAELVPGVSGGTIALVTGVYERIIDSADHVIRSARLLVTGPDRWESFRTEFARAQWALLVPLLLGMAAAVLTMAGVMEHFVATQPELSNGLFLGMVAASIAVPLLAVDRESVADAGSRGRAAVLFVLVAAGAFILTSRSGGVPIENPSMIVVFAAASVAICALVLPGVSGSFLLLVLGLYETTLGAVAARDLGYIAVFGAGAIVGLSLFVKGLHWLLHTHHTLTMVAMAGLMLGSLRALWPWKDASGGVLAPVDNWPWVFLLALVGAAGVIVLVVVDRALSSTKTAEPAGR